MATQSKQASSVRWRVFIAHASEDKASVARPLATALTERGIGVWLDEAELVVGQSLQGQIDEALRHAEVGAVIISPSFFAKEWPQRELRGLTVRELAGERAVVVPVWHNVDEEAVRAYSPPLADKYAISTRRGIAGVADEITKALDKRHEGPLSEEPLTPASGRRPRWHLGVAGGGGFAPPPPAPVPRPSGGGARPP